MNKLLLIIPLLTLLFLLGCANPEQPETDREQFQQEMGSRLDEFDQRIAEAHQEAEGLSGDAWANLNSTINELEQQRAALAARLEEMKAASDEEWQAFQTELEQASQDLQQAFGDLKDAVPQN
jgi:outer membrane murein-binding lipoprotein Lpp